MHRHLFPLNYLLPELDVQEFDLVDILKVAESQKVFHFYSNLQIKKMPNPSVKSAQWSDLAPYLGDWIQSEKLSEIKLPLQLREY